MKVLFTSPTYGPVDPACVRTIRTAVMAAANQGTKWLGDCSPNRMGYSDARNHACEFLADGGYEADGIMWVDSDIQPPPDAIARLLRVVDKHGFHFVSGVYHIRRGDLQPCFFMWDDAVNGFRINLIYEDNQIIKAAGCGFGFVYTSSSLIRRIAALPNFDRNKGGWFPDHHYGDVSEDLAFCLFARQVGEQLYVDTGIQVGHTGESEVITRATYLAHLAAKAGGKTPTPVRLS